MVVSAGPSRSYLPTMPLSLAQALGLIAAAHDHAAANGWKITVAVVDEGAHLVALGRMDGAFPLSAQIAEAKAAGTALWQRDGEGARRQPCEPPGILRRGQQAPQAPAHPRPGCRRDQERRRRTRRSRGKRRERRRRPRLCRGRSAGRPAGVDALLGPYRARLWLRRWCETERRCTIAATARAERSATRREDSGMLFHIKQTHAPKDCPYGKGGSNRSSTASRRTSRSTATGWRSRSTRHTSIVETDDIVHLQTFLRPGAGVTTCEITPVSDKPAPLPD